MTCRILNCAGPLLSALLFVTLYPAARADVVGFEDLGLPASSYENGAHLSGSFVSGGATFNNQYAIDPTYGYESWLGWSYSSMTDSSTPGFGNQYSAITGAGAGPSQTYGVAFYGLDVYNGFVPYYPTITLPAGKILQSFDVTNTAYDYYSMLNGDTFAKKFGGPTGTDPDTFVLTIHGLDSSDVEIGTLDFYLADYRNIGGVPDYIVNTWTTVDLSSLSGARKLQFTFTSTDTDPTFGMNTPAYFAMDNLVLANVSTDVPEPVSWVLLLTGVATLALWHRWRGGKR